MTGDYFAHLNFAFNVLQARNAEPATRATYFAILYKWNGFKRCRSFNLSDRELQNLTGLGSNATTRAKRKLKNLGLIDFKATRQGTTYFFTETPNTRQEASQVAPTDTQTAHSALFTTATDSNLKKKEEKAGGREERIWEM